MTPLDLREISIFGRAEDPLLIITLLLALNDGPDALAHETRATCHQDHFLLRRHGAPDALHKPQNMHTITHLDHVIAILLPQTSLSHRMSSYTRARILIFWKVSVSFRPLCAQVCVDILCACARKRDVRGSKMATGSLGQNRCFHYCMEYTRISCQD